MSTSTAKWWSLHEKYYPLIWLFVVVLIALYVQAWRATQIRKADFLAFYASGRLLRAGENPYARDAECQIQGQIRADLCMPNPHAPVLLPLFALISTEDYAASYTRWSVILLLVFSLCAWVAYKLSGSHSCRGMHGPIPTDLHLHHTRKHHTFYPPGGALVGAPIEI